MTLAAGADRPSHTSHTPHTPSPESCAVIRRLADTAASHERLPMLDVVFDKTARLLTESFLHLMSTDVSVKLEDLRYARFGDFMNETPSTSIIAITNSPSLDNSILIVIDSRLIFALSEMLLGGAPENVTVEEGGEAPRRPTNIELRLATRIFNLVAQRLGDAFETVSKLEFEVERLELNPQFAAVTRATSAAIGAKAELAIAQCKGDLRIILPYAALEPVKGSLQQIFMGERFGRDESWERHFEHAVKEAHLTFEAVLHQDVATLREVSNWKPGDVIEFDASAETQIRLMRDDAEFFRGPMGRKNGRIAVQIEEFRFPAAENTAQKPAQTNKPGPKSAAGDAPEAGAKGAGLKGASATNARAKTARPSKAPAGDTQHAKVTA